MPLFHAASRVCVCVCMRALSEEKLKKERYAKKKVGALHLLLFCFYLCPSLTSFLLLFNIDLSYLYRHNRGNEAATHLFSSLLLPFFFFFAFCFLRRCQACFIYTPFPQRAFSPPVPLSSTHFSLSKIQLRERSD